MELCSLTHKVPSPNLLFKFQSTFGCEFFILAIYFKFFYKILIWTYSNSYTGATLEFCSPKLSIDNFIWSPAFKKTCGFLPIPTPGGVPVVIISFHKINFPIKIRM